MREEVYVAEFVWPSEAMPCSRPSLKPITKNRREEARFTFDVSKCVKGSMDQEGR